MGVTDEGVLLEQGGVAGIGNGAVGVDGGQCLSDQTFGQCLDVLVAVHALFDGCGASRVNEAIGVTPTEVDDAVQLALANPAFAPIVRATAPAVVNVYATKVEQGTTSPFANDPFFSRFFAALASRCATFFSLWIGGNDVLGYATSGGVGVNQTGNNNAATYASNDITDPGVFAYAYNALITNLTANGAKGVVANLPYVSTLPYFTIVPINPLSTSVLGGGNVAVGQATISALNTQLYGPLKQVLTVFGAGDRINLLSTTVANPLLIKDESLTNLSAQLTAAFTPSLGAQTAAFYGAVFGQARQATATDLVLLPTQSVIGAAPTATTSGLGIAPPSPLNKFGITFPLQDAHVLIPSETAEIKIATDAYNTSIRAIADSKGLAFVDAKAIMDKLSTTGIVSNNFTMTATYVFGGSFSLDGVHPSPRGYALIANAFIEAINTKYSSTLKKVDLGNYRILFPASL